ncbi:MAG: cytochrome c [Gammaproteobacteria bacterium]|nr:cytochrome c [Gammaproteobacteria bacterium]
MKRAALLLLLIASGITFAAERFGLGTPASADDIARWDIDIKPDGAGLPPGQGAVSEGVGLYDQLCLACHGENGQDGQYDQLAGAPVPEEFATTFVKRTIGNYWPYASTLFDYVRRSMPQTQPGSLTDDEVYALVAYLLYLNGIVDADAIMNSESLPRVEMPAQSRFYWSDEVAHLR